MCRRANQGCETPPSSRYGAAALTVDASRRRLTQRGLLRAVGGVAFEGAVGGLVDAGGGLNHRPLDPGLQEPLDGLQPAPQIAFPAALQLAFPAQYLATGHQITSQSGAKHRREIVPDLAHAGSGACSAARRTRRGGGARTGD